MDQTLELSPKKASSEEVTQTPQEVEITDELLKTFKAQKKYPRELRSKILQYTDPKKRNIKKASLVRKNKKGQIVVQEKLDAFCDEFIKNGGNATEAAMAVFNVSSPVVAAQVGSVYLKKAKILNRIILEKNRASLGDLLRIAVERMERSSDTDWWDRVMELGGYGAPIRPGRGGTPTTNINIVQTERELFRKYAIDVTEGEIVEDEADLLESGEEEETE